MAFDFKLGLVALLGLSWTSGVFSAAPEHRGCFQDVGPSSPLFKFSGGTIADITPEKCMANCLKMGLSKDPAKKLAVGLAKNSICLCGFDLVTNLINLRDVSSFGAGLVNKCDTPCTGAGVSANQCGGSRAISGWSVSASSTVGLAATAATAASVDITGQILTVGTEVSLTLNIGSTPFFVCASGSLTCARANDATELPPLEITVDYGDGSGPNTWTETAQVDLWSHKYTKPGKYEIFVMTSNKYDRHEQYQSIQFEVVEDIQDPRDQIEIFCPDVVHPGTYFNCVMDIPRGTGLTATVAMSDDVDPSKTETTAAMLVPDAWSSYPGEVTAQSSLTGLPSTSSLDKNQAFVLMSTHFKSLSNISHLEFLSTNAAAFKIDVVKPVCGGTSKWCSLTKSCDNNCLTSFQTLSWVTGNHACAADGTNAFCSNIETCQADLTCPANYNGGVKPIGFEVVKTFDVTPDANKKTIFYVDKALLNDATSPYHDFKLHTEEDFSGDHFLAVRCTSACTFPMRPIQAHEEPDMTADFAGTTYTLVTSTPPMVGQIPVRVHLVEDRVIPIERKFFCDGATEKTVTLTVTDKLANNISKSTKKVSCQYPIMEIFDLSSNHTSNVNENSWMVNKAFPTAEELEADETIDKTYVADLWAREDEEITFHVRFGAGSHMRIDWGIEHTTNNGTVTVDDPCKIIATGGNGQPPDSVTGSGAPVIPFSTDDTKDCVFPFRMNNVLYYGCSNVTEAGSTHKVCATSINDDYDATELGECNDYCHVQYPRPAEVDNTISKEQQTFIESEGTNNVYQKVFILPLETELELKRTFPTTGLEYKVVLNSYNMHNPDDTAHLTWNVLCANPIVPEDWTLTFNPFIYSGTMFNITLSIAKNKPLATEPKIRIVKVNGEQRMDNDIKVDNLTEIVFYNPNMTDPVSPPDCTIGHAACTHIYEMTGVGIGNNINSLDPATFGSTFHESLTLSLPSIKVAGSYGFSVQLFNGISSVKFDPNTLVTVTEEIQLLDPAPVGTGEWLTIAVPKWDYNWVEVYDPIEGPVQFELRYTLPEEYGDDELDAVFVGTKWFMAASGHPSFNMSFYKGTPRRIQYTFNNTVPGEYQPPPCFIDWPHDAFGATNEWNIRHCPNVTEGTYKVVLSAWNPLDGWLSSRENLVEVLEKVGPIHIDDKLVINDMNEPKEFTITLDYAGKKTCTMVDWGDGSEPEFWGYLPSCQIRYPDLTASDVNAFDINSKEIVHSHVYSKRDNYQVYAVAFDELRMAETSLDIVIFKMECNAPIVWIPDNHTTWDKWDAVPMIWRSKAFQVQALSNLKCNGSATTYRTWSAYTVTLINDPDSHAGLKELLTPFQINETLPTYNAPLLDIPSRTFDYGLHKLVYRLEVETFHPTIKMFREAYTYFNITKSDLQPVIIDGSIARVSRGWGQFLFLNPGDLSKDPDYPDEKGFNITWWCRVIAPKEEKFELMDGDYPVFDEATSQRIPEPAKPALINPEPGCFGLGPGALKTRGPSLNLNSKTLVSYAQVYEIMVVIEKDTRRAKAKIELEMLAVPAPIVSIECASLCFPTFSGVYVNPTSRLAFRGTCLAECNGEETYEWSLINDDFFELKTTFFDTSSGVAITTEGPVVTTSPTSTTSTTTQPDIVAEVVTVTYTTDSMVTVVTANLLDNSIPNTIVVTTIPLSEYTSRRKREIDFFGEHQRSKRAINTDPLPAGYKWVFSDGSRDARDSPQLAIKEEFFAAQKPNKLVGMKLVLNITNEVYNGRKYVTAYGTSQLNILINDPPENGTCEIQIKTVGAGGAVSWLPAETGKGLIDEFRISCREWVDPNDHSVNKYVFKIVEELETGPVTTSLYSGPTRESIVVFPVGEFHLYAEIHEEAQAFTIFDIDTRFSTILPTEQEYNAVDVNALIAQYSSLKDSARVSQMLQADASIRAKACWFNTECAILSANPNLESFNADNITEEQQKIFDEVMKDITNKKTDALETADDSLAFMTEDQLAQGATTLASLTTESTDGQTTLDMKGRNASVNIIEKMAEGFANVEILDPKKLTEFLEGVSQAVENIAENIQHLLDCGIDCVLQTDLESAADLEYDTFIPDNLVEEDFPDDPKVAFQMNVMRKVRQSAVDQAKKVTELVDTIAEQVIINSVEGEELRTTTPAGMQMIMSKVAGTNTIGRDTNGDGVPDEKLVYNFEQTNTQVTFPLGFCPGEPGHVVRPLTKKCPGRWGIVIKEWATITATYPATAKRLNANSRQVDIDVYDDKGGKVQIYQLWKTIDIIIGRMHTKDPKKVEFSPDQQAVVDTVSRIKTLKNRKKIPLIYHFFNVTNAYTSITTMLKVDNPVDTRLVIIARHEKLPILTDCDYVKPLVNITNIEEGFKSWFLSPDKVNNRTGRWFFGVFAVKADQGDIGSLITEDEGTCKANGLQKEWLDEDFGTSTYTFRSYTSGCYYFNATHESWEADGLTTYNATRLTTACGTDHLTPFGSGWFAEPNTIDFDFIFAEASFDDNMTIYNCLILTFLLYLITLIWAIIADLRDEKKLAVPVLYDNHPEDNYLYEIQVETGPLASHGTTSKIYFQLDGQDDDTGSRCFYDPDRPNIFNPGALDSFIMTVPKPLGELNYIRIWNDNTGLGDSGAWYLLSVTITDVQSGERYRFVADQWVACDRGTYEDDIIVHGVPDNSSEDPYYLMKAGGMRKFADDHVWFSVFSRPIRSRFTRKQRTSVCMAVMYMTFLCNAMFYEQTTSRVSNPYFDALSLFGIDPYDVGVGIISNFIIFPPIILAILLFKRSRPFKQRKNRIDKGIDMAVEQGKFIKPNEHFQRDVVEPEKKRNRSWHSIAMIFGWLICLLCIFGGAFLVFAYALQFGNDKTYQWMVAVISAFFGSILVSQPLKIIGLTMLISVCTKKPTFNDDHCECDEVPPTIYYDPGAANNSPERPKPERKRFEPVFYEKLKERKIQEMEMKTVLRDLVIYLFYVAIIFIISYGNRTPDAYLSKSAIEASVIFGGVNCDILNTDDPRFKKCKPGEVAQPAVNFDKVRDVNDWYFWLENTLIPNVRVQRWYNGAPPYGLRGYLDDRVNRLIGYAIVRQVREELGTCKVDKVIRDNVEHCTGNGGIATEDYRTWCLGWVPTTSENCTLYDEFDYTTATDLKSTSKKMTLRTYGGGGYILRLTGFIEDLQTKINVLKENNWVDNRTRALIVEFSVYNAQVNLFSIVTAGAEFVGGGVTSYHRIDVIRLFTNLRGFGYVILFAEIIFAFSIFYYIINIATNMKKEGCKAFCNNFWNLTDIFTMVLSLMALALYVAKRIIVIQLTKEFNETRGNSYIRLTYVALINQYYEYLVSITVFTSTVKFSKLLSFQKAFLQIGATIKLCFQGLATFVVEFTMVFGAFCSFFFFVLKNDLENFRDFQRTVEHTMAMSIGKFNFAALRAADELAAWIFFVFSLVVNLILINMMMAIINLAFEEIKMNEDKYKNKFELIEYMKKSSREMIGIQVAQPIVPVYLDGKDEDGDGVEDEQDSTEKTSNEFSQKTDALLDYIEKTYLSGMEGMDDDEGARLMNKMRAKAPADAEDKKVMEYGFDALFMSDSSAKDEGEDEGEDESEEPENEVNNEA